MKKTLLLSVLLLSALSSAYAGEEFVEFPEWDTTGFVNEIVLKANHDWCGAHTVVEVGPLNYGNKYKDSIEVTATSDLPCALFTGWSDGVKAQTRFFSGSGTDTLTAYFESAPKTTHTIAPADEAMGDAYAQFGEKGEILRGQFEYDPENLLHTSEPLIINAVAKSGYQFTHWENGSTDSERVFYFGDNLECGQNYEFKAFFEKRKQHNIVILSSDTTIGTAWGTTKEGGDFTNGLISEGMDLTFHYEAIPGYTIDYMESAYYDIYPGPITHYSVVGDDTITVHFKKQYNNVQVSTIRRNELNLYGNVISSYAEETGKDTILVTDKATGNTLAYSQIAEFSIGLNDTFLVKARSTDGYTADTVLTLTFGNTSTDYHAVIPFNKTIEFIEPEEAEGDSFNVNIHFYCYWGKETFDSDTMKVSRYWNGNGRYAKGDTIIFHNSTYFCFEYGYGSASYVDKHFSEYMLPDTMIFVVNNNLNIGFYLPEPNSVEKVSAEEADALVNVYTISGRLLKENTKKSEALNGLEKGLYVVGRKLVRIKD